MKIGRRRLQAMILGISLAVAALVGNTPIGGLVERAFDPLRAAATRHAASGRVVVVEVDAASIAAIHRWPWSRTEHARVIDQLRRAGAASIVFDVDMSSNSTADGDAAMAAALARADGLVALPTFAQNARAGDASQIDALPIAAFRDHVALASVSIAPDSDGAIRRAPFGTMTRDTPRPSLSAYIARRSGAADTFFPIDFGIDPTTIPRLSFVAVRDGRFDPRIVHGRDIVIGATAVEMGDRYAVPHWGVIPGVTIQAIAAETLIEGVPAFGSLATVLAICLVLGSVVLRQRQAWSIAAASIVTMILFFGMVMAAQRGLHIVYPLTPGFALLALAAAGRFAALIASRFEQQRLVDETTGMPNRRAMLHVTDDTIVGHVAVAHIVNLDTLLAVIGEAGSRDLVMRIADRLRLSARGAAIYRLSDRSLGFVIDPAADLDDAMAGLRAVMLQPVEIQARRVDVAVAIGVADDGAGSALDERLNAAALAADAAERSGAFWQSGSADVAALERRVSLMGELDDALARGQIEVFYQPKLRLADDRIASVEALVRWRHPVRGFVPPDTFIPLAEQTDRIEPLTLFVMSRVLDDLSRWRSLGLGLTAAINISATLITKPSFDAALRTALAASPVPPSDLILEVTESATLADPAAAARMLGGYRDMGLAISMDDYGTGQSTLTYLRQLPLSELKIDRSFVQHAHRNRNDGLMVRSTIDLAHDLGLKVVAEGVEDEECLAFLRTLGCDLVQGYLIDRPMCADDLVTSMTTRAVAA